MNYKKIINQINIYNFCCFIFIFTIFFLVSNGLFYIFAVLSPVDIGQSYSIKIYDNENKVLSQTLYGVNGEYVELAKVPYHVQKAFIAIEDPDFYKHNGINFDRTVKALGINVINSDILQGGSTITQQFARNLYLDNKQKLSRKIKEAYYAINIESYYSKDRILEGYLNSVFLGHGIYGIEVAANYYFDKPVYQLSVAEAAMIAGICSAPNFYSPQVSLTRAKMKQELVLFKMYEQGYISASLYHQALSQELNFHFQTNLDNKEITGYYSDAVKQELEDLGLLSKKYLAQGLIIETNIDVDMTTRIDNIIKNSNFNPEESQLAIVVIKPYTNEVVSLIGGSNYYQYGFNRAINSYRQIGSTIKPLLYYLGLKNGMEISTNFLSAKSTFFIRNFGQYSPSNSNDKYADREINMIEALGTSDNIYATKTLLTVGSKTVADSLKYFTSQEVKALPSLALGAQDMSPLELTSLYNTFASEGTYHRPQLIKRVTNSKGKVIYKSSNYQKKLLDINNVITINQLLLSPFDQILAQNSYTNPTLLNYKPLHPWGAKSGSTQENSWVVGFNPNYTLGVYVGTDDNQKLINTTLSRNLFVKIANELSRNTEPIWYGPSYKLMAKRVEPVTLTPTSSGSVYYFPKIF